MGLGNQLRTGLTAAAPCATHKTEKNVLGPSSHWIRKHHYHNWDTIRPVAAGISGGVAGFAAGGPAGAAQGAIMATAAAI